MKKILEIIKKRYFIISIGLFFLLAIAVITKRPPVREQTPSEYLVSDKLSPVITTSPLDSYIESSLETVEKQNDFINKTEDTPINPMYRKVSYVDKKNLTIVKFIANPFGQIAATIRQPQEEWEKHISTYKNKAGLGSPKAIMYPVGAMSTIVEVYPEQGVALVVEKEIDFVYHVVLFKPTNLSEFKQTFSGLYLVSRDEKAY
ncbi:MAG: hypothetical protein KatS3mg101_0050 [Patescibacteria group bacterium]|nr:MAG: hypothetical protein KatS3mg101_0050 [Patescibacteria group bacterium]